MLEFQENEGPTAKVSGILAEAKNRLASWPNMYRKIVDATELSHSFDYEMMKPEPNDVTFIARIRSSEPEVTKVFKLPIKYDTPDYYSLLKILQEIGFDLYALLSMPKGDVFSITYGSISRLKRMVRNQTLARSGSPLPNKLAKREFLVDGQLHVRIYADHNNIYLTAHVDPPDIIDHVSVRSQLKGLTKADYPEGEQLFESLLALIKQSDGATESGDSKLSLSRKLRLFFGMMETGGNYRYTDAKAYDWFVDKFFARFKVAEDVVRVIGRSIDPSINQGHVLDQASGTGAVSLALASEGYNVTATDISPTSLEELSEKAAQGNLDVKTTVADFNETLPFPSEVFDVVTSVAGNRYIRNLPQFVQEVHRVLRTNGIFVWPIFSSDIPLWKRTMGLNHPTTSRALAHELIQLGFEVVERDTVGSLIRNTLRGVPPYAIPSYIIAKKTITGEQTNHNIG